MDITIEGSDKNPGMTNVMRCVGTKQGLLCLLLDVSKGFFPVAFALKTLSPTYPLFAIVMAAPVLGHAFSPILKGKGGKAIATTFGTFGGALLGGSNMFWILSIILIVFSVVVVITPHSLRMVVSMITLSVWAIILREPMGFMWGTVLISAVVIFKHITNFDKEPKKVSLLQFRKR
ncbi:Glycerol-3-phosphate acyltransferase [bioreactor metagenome]|uniref:Glycerol-3-phosphate acyltransferase n=1 Tax=bioreactor metagenome TaxID=1076179 RepID=A0A645FL27_9ZZZZ